MVNEFDDSLLTEVKQANFVTFGKDNLGNYPPGAIKEGESILGLVMHFDPQGGKIYRSEERCPQLKIWTTEGQMRSITCSQPNLKFGILNAQDQGFTTPGSIVKITYEGWGSKDSDTVTKAQKKQTDFKKFTIRGMASNKVTDEMIGNYFPPLDAEPEPF